MSREMQTEAGPFHDAPQATHSPKADTTRAATAAHAETATQAGTSSQTHAAARERETPIRLPLLTDHAAGTSGIGRTSQASVETRNQRTQKTEWRAPTTAAPLTRDRSSQTLRMPERIDVPVAATAGWRDRVPSSVRGNGHWVVVDAMALASDIKNQKENPSALSALTLSSDVVGSAGDVIAAANIRGGAMLGLASKALSAGGTVLGVVPSSVQLGKDAKELRAHPDSEQAKWNVGNDAVHLFGGLAAAAAAFAFPPAAAAALLFPNFAEIHHAEVLRGEVNKLRAEGRNTEADAMHTEYKEAALNATPLVNWFGPLYRHAMRPAVESFEIAQGNKPGTPPKDGVPRELPANATAAAKRYYQTALSEREKSFATKAKPYLKNINENMSADSVTLLSRSPQMFGWPATGQPMRSFERAVAITYSKHDDSVTARFLSPQSQGVFTVPKLDGIARNSQAKNLILVNNMLDPETKQVKFDMSNYKNDSYGDLIIADPKHYTV
ncbi:hypothetical protein LFL96_25485 [Paraburkholderia sp. D15]|uniref:hypothetical protein n=1 Tax=Paraburkholderia sp. D15 TaxID=2880218 RepID=UPI00247988B2|nr:hypothetical protein [Paraburkholderia sp. D15]WGS54369.1 hypothetical protein LFL96_25485 [Paraburkholderia sp. D15]